VFDAYVTELPFVKLAPANAAFVRMGSLARKIWVAAPAPVPAVTVRTRFTNRGWNPIRRLLADRVAEGSPAVTAAVGYALLATANLAAEILMFVTDPLSSSYFLIAISTSKCCPVVMWGGYRG
jgi:hypothetical protein